MIDWEKTFVKFGKTIDNITKTDKVVFVCNNCNSSYDLSYKTIKERTRYNTSKCRFCANKTLTDEERATRNYVRDCRLRRSPEKKRWCNRYIFRSWKSFLNNKIISSFHEDINKNRDFNINYDFVNDLLIKQNYKCALTGVDLVHEQTLFAASIDRIDNLIGHTIGNVQIVCRGINLAKNKGSNDDIKLFLRCLCEKEIFVPQKFSRDYLSSIVRNSIGRDSKKNNICTLTTDQIIDLYNKQDGKCKLTNLPLACYKHPCFSCSIDRIDNKFGHNIDNIQLVLKCINIAKSLFSNEQTLLWLKQIKDNYHE
jgi:hypothetical protein